jgi:hypothetical protein
MLGQARAGRQEKRGDSPDLLKQPRGCAEAISRASTDTSNMNHLDALTHPPDICLLLRVHAEQRWLISEVVPLLRQLERPDGVDEAEAGPAMAYLEVVWLEAGRRAAESDSAFVELDPADEGCSTALYEKACRYHSAVRRLRQAIDRRVRDITRPVEAATAQEPANS